MIANEPASEKLIGFDARKMWLDPAIHWDQQRRERFLLKMDVERPLSADELVWPSVFRTEQLPQASEGQLAKWGFLGPSRPDWIGPNRPLWQNLDELQHSLLVAAEAIPGPHRLIAVTYIAQPGIVSPVDVGPYLQQTNPDQRLSSWTFLGYDIGDGSLLSGLTNCGYSLDEKEQPPALHFVESLNQYHLFGARQAAARFRLYVDERVPEHAPFLVYGLYAIEERAH